jgi:hypothetical protein
MIRRKMSLSGRVLITVLVLAFGPVSASAYTVVMRDGRRVEIPNNFALTESTLTYEVSNGIQVTMQLSTVDVAATERVNHETSGSFLLKVVASKPGLEASQDQRGPARRSITNADLEQYRRARVEGEKERADLGLPTLEERQNEVAAIDDRMQERARNLRKQQEQDQEAYWRARADLFREQRDLTGAQPFDRFVPFDGFGFDTGSGRLGRFNRLPVSLFPGFLSTPITPFPSINPRRRPLLFSAPGTRVIVRSGHRRSH